MFGELTMTKKFATVLALCAAFATSASAAESVGTLTDVSGRVLVSSPAGLVLAHNGKALVEGSRVLVAAGGRATIATPSCKMTLSAGQELVLSKRTACASRTAQAATAPVVDGGQAEGLFAGLGGLSTTAIVIGAAAIVTTIAVVVENNRDTASGS
jgi:hypothetical protein